MNRYICIHGHFYQPPRENPWLEEIEIEDSAYPFHDWNERITAECYAPNASSRILGSGKEIIDIVNNYSRISFNFGPTLLSWIERHKPELYAQILQADRESQKRFSGHGSAIAQVYNHIIMPLAPTRDKQTEVIWGIQDFIFRFNRRPEGMWLAETAVDIETLDILAEQGILFTILDPEQAKKIKTSRDTVWTEIQQGKFDISKPYLCRLPTGRSIAIFFYDHGIASELAFGTLLSNGENFADRMMSTFSGQSDTPRILSIATDGETYGHHHRFGDMALAYALHTIESKQRAEITIFGEYLEKHPPTDEVEIHENSSWSCIHGVERWRSNCGCRTYHACLISDPQACVSLTSDTTSYNSRLWNQKWRTPLREAMNHLNSRLSELYEKEAADLFSDAWVARNEYIDIILDRSEKSLNWFFAKN
ncbi:MAG: glycoside hydrolase, partial [Methanomicrobiales archaeon HGW-Methanomicrobiales-4]